MHTVTRRIACFCETTFEADMPDAVDLGSDEGVQAAILQGDFMAASLPCLRQAAHPRVLLSGDNGGRHPRGRLGQGRAPRARGRQGGLHAGEAARRGPPPARIAIGMPELAEKILVFSSGLDDRVIEIMKYYLLTGSGAGPAGDSEVTLSYHGEEAGRMEFHIAGIAEGQIGVTRLSRDIYARIAADLPARLSEDPFSAFCDPPYVSLRKAEFTT